MIGFALDLSNTPVLISLTAYGLSYGQRQYCKVTKVRHSRQKPQKKAVGSLVASAR